MSEDFLVPLNPNTPTLKRGPGISLIEGVLAGRNLDIFSVLSYKNAFLFHLDGDEGFIRIEVLPDGRLYLLLEEVGSDELNEETGVIEPVRLNGEYFIAAPRAQEVADANY